MKYIDMPKREQPRRRLKELGGQSLSAPELLAVALWIGDSDQAIELAGLHREYGSLARIPRERITAIKGLGERYADALQAVWEIGRREALAERAERPIVHSPSDAAGFVMYEMSVLEQEQLRVILLDVRSRVIRIVTLYQGSATSAQVRVGEVFREAIRENACSVIVCHNHPSGDPTPSPDDVGLTRAIVQAGKTLDIEVLDHLVIGQGQFVSLKERGLGF